MIPWSCVGVILFSSVLNWCLIRALIPQLRLKLLDQPNVRSSHSLPTPRGGGLSCVVVVSISSGLALLDSQVSTAAALPLLAAPLAFVGLLDDWHNLPASWRYGIQLLTAIFMVSISSLVQRFDFAVAGFSGLLLLALALLVIAVTAVINFTNFMDGLDGLVAGCMAVTIASLTIALDAPWPLWALVGSLVGFLFWNWSPAKVFMGDVGSTFLGAVFAGLVLQASGWLEAFGYLLVATPCWQMLAYVYPADCLLANAFFNPTVFTFFALAPGWLASRPCFTYLHVGNSSPRSGHARRRLVLGIRPRCCGALCWGLAGSACGGAFRCGV